MKALLLISGGIDSAVASHIMLGKGLKLSFIHFSNEPFTNKRPLEKTRKLIRKIAPGSKLYIVQHGKLTQKEIIKNTNRRYNCILCRRMMFRIAEKIAEKEGFKFLITGESLGQVASQTLSNLTLAGKAIKTTILRPLLCYDKNEVIEIARKIGTYGIAIEPSICCKAVPKYPATRSKEEIILEEEKKFNVKKLVEEAEKNVKVEDIS